MRNVKITVLNEKMGRYRYENFAIWHGAGYAKTEGRNVKNLCQPPFIYIFEKVQLPAMMTTTPSKLLPEMFHTQCAGSRRLVRLVF